MNRLQFLKMTLINIVLNFIGSVALLFALQSSETYQQLAYGLCGLVLFLGSLYMTLRSTADRIKNVNPKADLILYSAVFWILNILTSGIAYFILMVWPPSRIDTQK
jgi:hypothetical protein